MDIVIDVQHEENFAFLLSDTINIEVTASMFTLCCVANSSCG